MLLYLQLFLYIDCNHIIIFVVKGRVLHIHPEKVLLVDDNDLLLASVKRFLEKDYYRVDAVCTGEEAIELLQRGFFHIVVLDVKLPGIDGWKVLEHIKNHRPLSKVVVITSDGDEKVKEHALQGGAFEFLEKPFDLGDLKHVLAAIRSSFARNARVYKTFEVRFDTEHRGFTQDLSCTGMFIVANVPIECGTTLEITLCISDNEFIPLKGRVVRTTEASCQSSLMPQRNDAGAWGKYGLGIQLIEHPPAYPYFVNSLMN